MTEQHLSLDKQLKEPNAELTEQLMREGQKTSAFQTRIAFLAQENAALKTGHMKMATKMKVIENHLAVLRIARETAGEPEIKITPERATAANPDNSIIADNSDVRFGPPNRGHAFVIHNGRSLNIDRYDKQMTIREFKQRV